MLKNSIRSQCARPYLKPVWGTLILGLFFLDAGAGAYAGNVVTQVECSVPPKFADTSHSAALGNFTEAILETREEFVLPVSGRLDAVWIDGRRLHLARPDVIRGRFTTVELGEVGFMYRSDRPEGFVLILKTTDQLDQLDREGLTPSATETRTKN